MPGLRMKRPVGYEDDPYGASCYDHGYHKATLKLAEAMRRLRDATALDGDAMRNAAGIIAKNAETTARRYAAREDREKFNA